jgi:hypothetical protein
MMFAHGAAIAVVAAGLAGIPAARSGPSYAAPDRPMYWTALTQLRAGIEAMAQVDDRKTPPERDALPSGPVISAPTVREAQPVPQGRRLDTPTLPQAPEWKPGDPARIMPDLRRSDQPPRRDDQK